MKTNQHNAGFTLIEVLISLAIFTIIGVATAKYIQQVRDTKELAFKDMALYNAVRTALSTMRFDLSQSFHLLYEDLGEETKQAVMQNVSTAHTIFDGRRNQLVFTSLSHRVYYQGKRECEQTEISYFLQAKKNSKFSSLMKRESPLIDDNLYEGGTISTLLEDVKEMSFGYYDEKTQKWVDDWSSDESAYRDRFPPAVKVKLSTEDTGGKPFVIETQFKVAFPNNQAVLVQF